LHASFILHNFIKHQNRLQQISDEDEFDRAVRNNISAGDNFIASDMGANDGEIGEELREDIKNIL
jgi:hypothetical protein